MKRRGFTLSELLVSISIISILTAMTFGALRGSMDAAKGTVCVSNLRQVTVAMKLYQADHGDYPPTAADDEAFKPYYTQILTCPVSRRPESMRANDYSLIGQPIGRFPHTQEVIAKSFAECRELRQDMMPLVLDTNHRPRELKQNPALNGFLLVARESGSIHRVVPQALDPRGPCDSEVLSYRFNY